MSNFEPALNVAHLWASKRPELLGSMTLEQFEAQAFPVYYQRTKLD